MKILNSQYIKSCVKIEDCPTEHPEFAFIGRSNVGKSSIINMLTDRKNLAKTSAKPGKTQTINYFLINYLWYLVDLPGYGYAKASKNKRSFLKKIINNYILRSPNLMNIFVLIDASIAPQKNDIDFIYQMGINEIPLSLIFTKSDKISKNKLNKNIITYKQELKQNWEELPKLFISSTITKKGKNEILDYIEYILKNNT